MNAVLYSIIFLCWICYISRPTLTFKIGKCPETTALGMESKEILDSQIIASSSFDIQSVGPQNARIRTEMASGAWCPKQQISNTTYEYLQINLNKNYVIQKLETQGRYGNGTGREYTPFYYLEYTRKDEIWIRYQNISGDQLIAANENTIDSVMFSLTPPIIASSLRIIPFSYQTRTACLRAELHGCVFEDQLLGYSMSSQGSKMNQEDFRDLIFDGLSQTNMLDSVYVIIVYINRFLGDMDY